MKSVQASKVGLFVFVVASFLLCAVSPQQAVAAEPIRIGAIFSVTGPLGFIGTPQRDATIAMIEDVNKRGGLPGGRQIELFIEDDKTVPTNAVIAMTKLARDKKVSAIVGPSAAIRDAVEKVRFDGFVGPFAPTPTDHQGSPTSATVPVVLKNGEFYPWQK